MLQNATGSDCKEVVNKNLQHPPPLIRDGKMRLLGKVGDTFPLFDPVNYISGKENDFLVLLCPRNKICSFCLERSTFQFMYRHVFWNNFRKIFRLKGRPVMSSLCERNRLNKALCISVSLNI
ncbi:hypothetical protein AVEN_212148-1 [Araneus ventricosus]|uniref:Uncharacterized protein n=1 Tax=Araneus ventricosus TaxID=182803 RepID=A0A4Y2U8M4_ARAVE|nr:hypothetical protein AVEN_97966-1 [Araneus ventricosus]GBO07940.1 hypothetical protein AVEN_212148-1 [Araneus ventricosus]